MEDNKSLYGKGGEGSQNDSKCLSKSLEENRNYFHRLLRVDQNFDVVVRSIIIGGRQACVYLIDGFTENSVLQRVLQYLGSVKADTMPKTAEEFADLHLP